MIGVRLDHAISDDEEKALGVFWDVENDQLYIKADLEKPSKQHKKTDIYVEVVKVDAGMNIGGSDVKKNDSGMSVQVKPHLTLRVCLSLHSKPYDPLGLLLPLRMVGNLLFRNTLQDLKRGGKGAIPWDEPIVGRFKD